MFYLFLSILFNAYIGILFAYFQKYRIDIFQAIVFNYGVCVLTGMVVLGQFSFHASFTEAPYMKWAVVMGVLFISVFNLIGLSSSRVGITITQTANKLSLVIPVIFSYYLYHESITAWKAVGIAMALIAVVFISVQSKDIIKKKVSWLAYAIPIILFISSGIIDTLTKYVQTNFLVSESISNAYLICGFFTAFIIGMIALCYYYVTKKKKFQLKYLYGGVLLGIPNYFSIYFLVKALQSGILNSSAIIPINNIGVLFVVSLFGILVFHEKLNRLNYLGLLLSIVAILLIFFGDKII